MVFYFTLQFITHFSSLFNFSNRWDLFLHTLFSYLTKYLFMLFHLFFHLFNLSIIQSIDLFAYPLKYFFPVFDILFDNFITLCLYFIVQLLTDSFTKLSYQIVYLELGMKDISEIGIEHKRSNNLSLKLKIPFKFSSDHLHDMR